MLDTGGIGSITTCLSQAALAGLASFSQQLLEQLTLLIAQENQFAEMGQALEVLYALWRLDEISGMQGAQILQTTLCAAIDRTLWLCESNGRPDERSFTLTCIAGKRFAISCAIYIAALIYPAFLFAAVALPSDAVRRFMPRR